MSMSLPRVFFSLNGNAEGCQLRIYEGCVVFHNCESGRVRTPRGSKAGFWAGFNDYQIRPLFGPDALALDIGLPFGLLVKWAVKLLGNGGPEEQSPLNGFYPRQCVDGLFVNKGIIHNRPLSKPSAELWRAMCDRRGDRGIDLPPSSRSLFFMASATKRIEIDGIELRWLEAHDEWAFSTNEVPLATAVKFAVRILRDVKTQREWPRFFVPWLADEDELVNGPSEPASSGGSLNLLALDQQESVGLAKVSGGYQLVQPEVVEECADGIIYSGNPSLPVSWTDWGSLVDSLAEIMGELQVEVIQQAGGTVPLWPHNHRLNSWLYTRGSRPVSLKEENRAGLKKEIGGSGVAHSRLSDSLREQGAATIASSAQGAIVLQQSDVGISLVSQDGGNPVLGIESLLTLLGMVISDSATQRERPLQWAPWMLTWVEQRRGAAPVLVAVPAAAQPPPKAAPTPAPAAPAPSPAASPASVANHQPQVVFWRLPKEIVEQDSPSASPPALSFGQEKHDKLFEQEVHKILAQLRQELKRT